MDISLNIATNTSSAKASKVKSTPAFRKKKFGGGDGFDFNFVKNDKIKAVVARKRPAKAPVTATASSTTSIFTNQTKVKVSPSEPTVARLHKDNEDILLSYASVKQPEDEVSLSLNIDTSVDASKRPAFGGKKQKLSRDQRKERVMQRRIDAVAAAKTESKPAPRPFQKMPKKPTSLFKDNLEVPLVGQRFVKPLQEIVFTGLPMNSIGLHPHLVKTMADLMGITELTNVQQRTVPVALERRDILVRSQTGSGKTLAYALPLVHQLQEMRPKLTRTDGIRAVVIVPTRELAIQTLEVFIKLLKPFTWIVPTYITGGEKRKSEKARLRKGINILIGTPGRICDHLLHTESFKLDKVKYLVLDEADRLFELGYEKDVKIIVEALNITPETKNPFALKAKALLRQDDVDEEAVASAKAIDDANKAQLQSILLSATLSSAVHQLAGLALKNPLFIDTCDQKNVELPETIPIVGTTSFDDAVENAENIVLPETVSQSFILVPPKLRLVTLSGLIATETIAAKKPKKILIFFATEQLVDFHYDLMREALTKKVIDSEDEDENDDEVGGKRKRNNDDPIALLNNSDSELEDEEEYLAKAKAKMSADEKPLLGDVKFFKLHGSLTQQERSAIFKEFKAVKSGVLLTTDVTARGIDVPLVDLIIQYSPPHQIADYVHRVGRTARAGRTGSAVLFLAPNETEFIRTLEDKRIRIAQFDYKNYLKGIDQDGVFAAGTLEEKASELQRKFESLIAEEQELNDRACKAFVSWLRFTSSFPKDLRAIFNVKNSHMGHYAKSLGLREPPKSFTKQFSEPKAPLPNNRLTYTDRTKTKPRPKDAQTVKRNGMKRPINSLHKFVSKSISLSTSEFDSGMPAMKKRKNK